MVHSLLLLHLTRLINAVTDDQVRSAPTFPEIYPHFVDLIANKAVVIYNAHFDEAIFRYCCNLAHFEAPNFIELHCAMHWYAQWVGDWSNHHGNYRWPKLPGGDHTAIGDCLATLKIIQMMASSFIPESELAGETPGSQESPIRFPEEQTTSIELQYSVGDAMQICPNQDEQTTATNDELETLIAHAGKKISKERLSPDILKDIHPGKENRLIQEEKTVDIISKKDLRNKYQQTAEELSSEEPSFRQPEGASECINLQKVQAYMRARELGLKQADAAYIAGFSERTGRRLEKGESVGTSHQVGRSSSVKTYETLIYQWLTESLASGVGQLKTSIVLARLQEIGYKGGKSAVYDFVRQIRPPTDMYPVQDNQIESIQWMQKLLQRKVDESDLSPQYQENLTSKEVLTLLECISSRPIRYRNRAIAVLAYLKNIPSNIIAEFLLITPETVSEYIKNYQTGGVCNLLDVYKRDKVKKSEDQKYKNKIFEILHSPPSNHGINRTSWKMSDIYRIMEKEGLKLSQDNIRKIIKDAGYSVRKAKKVLTSTDPNYREKLQEITQTLSNLGPKDKFFSIDEFGPFSVKIQGGRSLMPPGEVKTIPQWQKSKGKLIMTAALELSTNQVTHFYSEKKDTEEMIKLLDVLLEKYLDEDCIYLSWDAASWHASHALYEKVDEVNSSKHRKEQNLPLVKLVPLPAGAQFLNIIESVFSGMARAIIHNSNYQSVEDCKDAIDRYFFERNQYFIEHPKRAGKKIWGEELVEVEFKESNNCKDPRWR